jgi:hypothetical protein
MDSSKVISVAAFFVAGLVIAVGGALIYSMAHGLRRPIEPTRVPMQVRHPAPPKRLPATVDVAKLSTPTLSPLQHGSIADVAPRPRPKPRARTTASAAKARAANLNRKAPQIARQMPTIVQPGSPEAMPQTYALPSQASQQQEHVVTLESGTAITIELTEKLSTDYDNTGDTFRSVLAEPVEVNGLVIADRGATVVGRVEYAHRAGFFGGASELVLTLTEIHTSDSHSMAIRTDSCEQIGSRTNVRKSAKLAADLAAGTVLRAVSGVSRAAGLSSSFDDNFGSDQAKAGLHRSVVLPIGIKLMFHVVGRSVISNE